VSIVITIIPYFWFWVPTQTAETVHIIQVIIPELLLVSVCGIIILAPHDSYTPFSGLEPQVYEFSSQFCGGNAMPGYDEKIFGGVNHFISFSFSLNYWAGLVYD